jgi:hypothetical protein
MREEYHIRDERGALLILSAWNDVAALFDDDPTLHYVGAELDKHRNVIIMKFVCKGDVANA